jgi:hypothetical protein
MYVCKKNRKKTTMKYALNGILLKHIMTSFHTDAEITGWTVPVIDGNAEGPGTLSIQESQATNTKIETYVATSVSAPVTYSLVTAVTPFALSTTGELTITAALDFETETSYTLHVKYTFFCLLIYQNSNT